MIDFILIYFGFLIICLILATITLSLVAKTWKDKCDQMQKEIDDFKQFKRELRELNLIKELNL